MNSTVLVFGASSSIASHIIKSLCISNLRPVLISRKPSIDYAKSLGLDSYTLPNYSEESLLSFFDSFDALTVTAIIILCGSGTLPVSLKSNTNTTEAWNYFLDCNLLVPVRIVETFLGIRKVSRSSDCVSIVLLSSVASILNAGAPAAYACAKSALNCYTRTLIPRCQSENFRINAVLPSHIESPTWDRISYSDPQRLNSFISKTASRRLCSGDDVAEIVSFLVSSQSEYLCGQQIVLDSGSGYNSVL